jgi:hypothetical protein
MRSRACVLWCTLVALVLGVAPAALAVRSATFVFDTVSDPGDLADGPDFDVTGQGVINDGSGCDAVTMIMVDATGTVTDVDSFCLSLATGLGGSDGDYGSFSTGYVPTLGPVTYALYDLTAADLAALVGFGDNDPEFVAYVVANARCLVERTFPVAGVPVGAPFTFCRKPAIGTGTGTGGVAAQTILGAGVPLLDLVPYTPAFTGGVRVALGDVNGDGVPDLVTGAGPGGGPHVRVFDGTTGAGIRSFFAYTPAFTGGVLVAGGDVNGDGFADIITGAGPGGGPHVRVFNGATGAEIRGFFAYNPAFTGGVFVAGGDVNADGAADVITGAGPGGGPHVKAFSGATGAEIRSFFAYDPAFTGGVRVGGADLNSDGAADIITGAGPGGGPHVKAFDGVTGALLQSFFADDAAFTGGIFVAGAD